ncbi:hypothetical protein FQA47_011596 [Oryzias melastigma]|uniref:Uncharacterized protein n=1 Tax=Oryzias melastigma TaxID=30732 RepID=A0A834CKH9_ORYME|nr:hypothetical protein FQA47_011596 [Oryzias melastigma]
MYCPFCASTLVSQPKFCCSCGKNISFLYNADTPQQARPSEAGSSGTDALALFHNFRAIKDVERRSCFKKKKNLKQNCVKISVGIIKLKDNILRPVRGSCLPLVVEPGLNAKQLQEAAERKIRDFDKNSHCGPYLLPYPDGSEVACDTEVPGTSRDTMTATCYGTYTQLYAPVVIEDEVDSGSDAESFKRRTFSLSSPMMEGGWKKVSTLVAPKEFLSLLMKRLSQRPIFDGPTDSRYLVYNSADTECIVIGEPARPNAKEQHNAANGRMLLKCDISTGKALSCEGVPQVVHD